MTSKVRVICLPYHNSGGHFIDWSIHYVCNQTDSGSWSPSERNWHHHRCHRVRGHQDLISKIQSLHENSTSRDVETIYYTTAHFVDILMKTYKINIENAEAQQITQTEHAVAQDYQLGVQYCQDHDLLPVFVDYCPSDFSSLFYNDRYALDWDAVHDTKLNIVDKWNRTFFPDAVGKFEGTVWDKRELAALTYRASKALPLDIRDLIDQTRPHLYYTTDDVWNGFDRCLEEICHLWDVQVDPDRWLAWKNIYHNWRTVHDPYFARHLPRIVDAIVKNKYLSLRRFHMNFFMEVLIQHELIFKHNLNIKTWQLDRFPDNTQDLHALLEPNFHQL